MTVFDWFEQGINIPVPDGRVIHAIVGPYMAELLVVNGGSMSVTAMGRKSNQGMYGREGLEPWEACIFMRLIGTMEGFLLATGAKPGSEAYIQVQQHIQEEINKKRDSITAGTGFVGGVLDSESVSKPKPTILIGSDLALKQMKAAERKLRDSYGY